MRIIRLKSSPDCFASRFADGVCGLTEFVTTPGSSRRAVWCDARLARTAIAATAACLDNLSCVVASQQVLLEAAGVATPLETGA